MGERFDNTIDFVDLRKNIDVTVKNFSGIMIVRIRFAIVTAVKADVLIGDVFVAEQV